MAKLIDHESVRRKRGRGNGNRNASIEAARAFEAGVGRDVEADRERKVEKLHAKIGQLAVERDFLAKSPEDERAGLGRLCSTAVDLRVHRGLERRMDKQHRSKISVGPA